MVSLVKNSLRRARELVEQRRTLDQAQVWIAGIIAIVEHCRRDHLAAKQRQKERITNLVANLGNGTPAKGLGDLLSGVRVNTSARCHQRTPQCCGRRADIEACEKAAVERLAHGGVRKQDLYIIT